MSNQVIHYIHIRDMFVHQDVRFDFESGKNFIIGNVQLEEGSVATPFEQRPYGLELSLCQRYYESSYSNGVAVDYLHAVGLLSFSYMFAKIANAASQKDGEFFANKVQLARYFVARILPDLKARLDRIQSNTDLVMGFDADYFTNQS